MIIAAAAMSWYEVPERNWPPTFGAGKEAVRTFDQQRLSDVKEIMREVRALREEDEDDIQLVVFPGWTRIRHRHDKDPKKSIKYLRNQTAKIFRSVGVSAMFEVFGWYDEDPTVYKPEQHLSNRLDADPNVAGGNFIYKHNEKTGNGKFLGPIKQWFADSKEANSRLGPMVGSKLVSSLRPGGDHTVEIGGVKIGFFICSETTILKNIQREGNRAEARYGYEDDESWLDHDVIINPFHASMGNMHKHMKRWERLSQNGRVVIACGSNKNVSWNSALYVYQDGELIIDGGDEAVLRPDHDNWRLALVEV